ncbi:MAG: helix-hairpin-helix domain-containing protein [Dehalococcoidales bacterium]|nr:helix-hairpin-helix domain-containing protein [Dehalococcoidales bacterium]
MLQSRFNRYWMLVTILLVVIIAVGGSIVWLRYSPGRPVEIYLPPAQDVQGAIYIGGNINNPGFYPFTGSDSLEKLLRAAGGATVNANLMALELDIGGGGETGEPQKIDINRADSWLLKALPGIGDTLAQRIVDYRQQNGPFLNIQQLLEVDGIGITSYQRIESLITVAE